MRTAILTRGACCETVLKRLHVEDGKVTRPEYNAPFAIIARANGSGTVSYGGPSYTIGKTPTVSVGGLSGGQV